MLTRYGSNRVPVSGIHRCTALLLVSMLLLSACGGSRSDPEAQLRAWVAAVEEAAEAKERKAIMALIGDTYTDARGNGPSDIENLLRLYFLRQNKIVLLTQVEEVRIHDRTAADLRVTVGMAGTNNSLLGIRADAYRFELELEARDGSESFQGLALAKRPLGAIGAGGKLATHMAGL